MEKQGRNYILRWWDVARLRVGNGIRRWDWRIWSILAATVIAIAITFAIPFIWPSLWDITKFQGGFFASWVAGVALFALVGLVVAIVSVYRPDRESFDARARNFLQRQHGGHINYMVDKLRATVEPYVDHTEKRLVVENWHEASGKLRIRHETKTRLRGFLNDVSIKFPAKLNYISYCEPPSDGDRPCLSYIRVNGEEKRGFEEFDRELLKEFDGEAPGNEHCLIEHVMSYWIEPADEVNRHKTVRYTKSLEVIVENRDTRLTMMVDIKSGAPPEKIPLKPGEQKRIIKLSEMMPDQYVYDFRILPVRPEVSM